MSDIVEKTLAAFPKFLSEGLLGASVNQSSPNRGNVQSGLRHVIGSVYKARSKSDEDLIIKKELSFLQQRLSQPSQSSHQIRETYSRLLFCFTLGYDVSFSIIHAVKLAQQGTGMQKRYGYLMSCLLLHENHEMLVLLINTIQKDMKSTNLLDNCMSLLAASTLLNSENIPMFLPLVLDKLKHRRELVRIKAAHCLHRFYLKAPNMLVHAHANFHQALCDKDPAVIQGIVQIYVQLARTNPEDYVHLGASFLSILSQIINGSFPAQHEYHAVPLPWLQIQLLKLLAYLGAESQDLRVQMYPVLRSVMQKSTVKHNIAFAVLYECMLTISYIRGDQQLLTEVSECVAKFLGSSSNMLRYLGIKALTALVGISPEYAVQHQAAVVECLDGDEKDTQRKTLELLYKMANQSNVKAICSKLFEHQQRSDDPYFKDNMAIRIAQLAEKFSPDVRWYVQTINSVLQHTPGTESSLADRLMDKLETEIHTTEDEDFEQFLASSYLPFLDNANSSDLLLRLAVWVYGELQSGLKTYPPARILSSLSRLLTRTDVSVDVKSLVLTSLVKLVVRGVLDTATVRGWLQQQNYGFRVPQLQQKLQELTRLVSISNKSCKLPHYRNGSKHKQFDFSLTFLDDFVSASLETGGSPYKSLGTRIMTQKQEDKGDKYGVSYQEIISQTVQDSPRSSQRAGSFTASTVSEGSERDDNQTGDSGLKMSNVKRVWGKEGLLQNVSIDTPPTSRSPDSHKSNKSDAGRKGKLAQALFEGISNSAGQEVSPQQVKKKSETSPSHSSEGTSGGTNEKEVESCLPSSDVSGWRAFSARQMENIQGHNEKSDKEICSGFDDLVLETTPQTDTDIMSLEENTNTTQCDWLDSEASLLQSSQSERREIWLANESSPEHVQYKNYLSNEVSDFNNQLSIYDEFGGQSNEAEMLNTEQVEDKTLSSGSDSVTERNSLYSEYYSSQS